MFVHILRPAQMFPLLYSVGKIAGKCDVTHFSDGSGCLNAYFLRIKTAVSRASHGTKGVFCIAPFFVAIPLFGIGVRSNHRLTFPYSKVAAKARRPDLNIIRFLAVGPDAFRTRLK